MSILWMSKLKLGNSKGKGSGGRWVQRRRNFVLSLEQQGISRVCESGLTRSDLVFMTFTVSSMESGWGKGLRNGCGESRHPADTMPHDRLPQAAIQWWAGSIHKAREWLPSVAASTCWGQNSGQVLTGFTLFRGNQSIRRLSTLPVLAQLVGTYSQPPSPPSLFHTDWALQMLEGWLMTASKIGFSNSFAIKEIWLTILIDELLLSYIFRSFKSFSFSWG